jgi:hypothetical protein
MELGQGNHLTHCERNPLAAGVYACVFKLYALELLKQGGKFIIRALVGSKTLPGSFRNRFRTLSAELHESRPAINCMCRKLRIRQHTTSGYPESAQLNRQSERIINSLMVLEMNWLSSMTPAGYIGCFLHRIMSHSQSSHPEKLSNTHC